MTYKRPPKKGTRVIFHPNPVSLALYSPPTPAIWMTGTVVGVSGIPGGHGHYLKGPGGGLLYVKWDDIGIMGVSLYDVEPATKASWNTDGEALEGIVKLLLEDTSGRGERPWVLEVEADSFEDAVKQEFAKEYKEWLEESRHIDNFIDWAARRYGGVGHRTGYVNQAFLDRLKSIDRRDEALVKREFADEYEQWLETLSDEEESMEGFLEYLAYSHRMNVQEVD